MKTLSQLCNLAVRSRAKCGFESDWRDGFQHHLCNERDCGRRDRLGVGVVPVADGGAAAARRRRRGARRQLLLHRHLRKVMYRASIKKHTQVL